MLFGKKEYQLVTGSSLQQPLEELWTVLCSYSFFTALPQLNSQSTGRDIFAKWNILDRKVLDTKSLQQAQQTVHLHRVAAGLISEREAIELHVDECSMDQAWSLLMASCSVCTRCSKDSGKPDAKRPQVF